VFQPVSNRLELERQWLSVLTPTSRLLSHLMAWRGRLQESGWGWTTELLGNTWEFDRGVECRRSDRLLTGDYARCHRNSC